MTSLLWKFPVYWYTRTCTAYTQFTKISVHFHIYRGWCGGLCQFKMTPTMYILGTNFIEIAQLKPIDISQCHLLNFASLEYRKLKGGIYLHTTYHTTKDPHSTLQLDLHWGECTHSYQLVSLSFCPPPPSTRQLAELWKCLPCLIIRPPPPQPANEANLLH